MEPTHERISLVKTAVFSGDYKSPSQRRRFTRLVDSFSQSTLVLFGSSDELKSLGETFLVIDTANFSDMKKKFLFNAIFNSQ